MSDIMLKTLAAAVLKVKREPWAQPQEDTAELAAPPEPETAVAADLSVNIILVKTPNSGMKGLVRIRQVLGLSMTIGELLSKAQHLPLTLLEGVSLSLYRERCAAIKHEEDCIEVVDHSSLSILNIGSL